MLREQKVSALRAHLGRECFSKGDEYVFMCPRKNCESVRKGKPKLSVNVETEIFNCWVCSFKGKSLVPLFPKGSRERNEYVRDLEQVSLLSLEEKEVKYKEPSLPPFFHSLSERDDSFTRRQIVSYLNRRGIDEHHWLKWKLGYCSEGPYSNRVICPSFDRHGSLNFCVGRSIFPGMLKYKHDEISKDIIWNDYMVNWDRPVTITEGPFDAFKIDDNVVALQGSILRVGSKLFSRIVEADVPIYFAMDTDAFKKQTKIIESMLLYGVSCFYVDLGNHADAGEMTKQQFESAKSAALPVRGTVDILRMRLRA